MDFFLDHEKCKQTTELNSIQYAVMAFSPGGWVLQGSFKEAWKEAKGTLWYSDLTFDW